MLLGWAFERPGSRRGTCCRSPLSAGAQKYPYRYRRPPPTPPRVWVFSVPALLVVLQLSVPGARRVGSVPPSVRKLPSLAILGKGELMTSRGFPPVWPPRVPARDPPFNLRAAFALVSTAARASPLRVRGGITWGRACRPATGAGAVGVCRGGGWWLGKGRAHARVRGTPPLPPRVAVGWEAEGFGGGLPVPLVSGSFPCLPSRASLLLASASWGRYRGACVPLVVACCVLSDLCGCRLAPPSSVAFPRLVGSREPSSPPRG